jgi:hypothetical protein
MKTMPRRASDPGCTLAHFIHSKVKEYATVRLSLSRVVPWKSTRHLHGRKPYGRLKPLLNIGLGWKRRVVLVG